MTNTFNDLDDPITVPFDRVFIDPNNPRIAEERETRYQDPDEIFDPDLQAKMAKVTYDVYQAKTLEDAIIAQGWVPIDAIIVWEHPDRPKHYIVVEGNTRTSVLRNLRSVTLDRERKKLQRIKKGARVTQEEVKRQEALVAQLETIISDTDHLTVYPVNATTVSELEKKLPGLLGVRHIVHARPWGPYAENLFMLTLYRRLFAERYGEGEDLRLEQDLIDQVAAMVSLGPTKTRRNIQAAFAFGHFKMQFEDRLPEGEAFVDGDHYFFENILQNKYAQEQFGFTKDRLTLPDEAEEALFAWAFSKPRKGGEDKNQNVLYKAENIRLWSSMAKYDSSKGTAFASQFDVDDPAGTSKTMRVVEADYLHHKAQQTPLNALQSMLETLKNLKGETLIAQGEFLKPMLEEIVGVSGHYLNMIDADSPK